MKPLSFAIESHSQYLILNFWILLAFALTQAQDLISSTKIHAFKFNAGHLMFNQDFNQVTNSSMSIARCHTLLFRYFPL